MNIELSENNNNFIYKQDIPSILLYGEYKEGYAPKFSIAIPTRKRSNLLKKNIDSILNQTKQDDFEIVIVDDEPEWEKQTETELLIKSYNDNRIYYYRNQQNLGMVRNWNRCIELSRGEYVTILHDDDWLEPTYLEECSKRVNGSNALYFRTRWVDEREGKKYEKSIVNNVLKKVVHCITPKQYKLTPFSCFMTVLSTNGVMYKRSNVIELGGFDEKHYPGGDYTFNSKYILTYGGTYHKLCLTNYRIAENESLEVSKVFPELIYIVRGQLIEYCKYNHSLLQKMRELFYDYDVQGIKKQWNTNVDNDLLEGKIKRNTLIYKIQLKALKTYILFYKIYYLL